MILDTLRRKFVRLTPEEWVRQHFIRYLINQGGYPAGLIGVEIMINLNGLKKRVDILVHNRQGKPVMIVECKETSVELTNKVCDQIVEYNMALKVPYILITNGNVNLACKLKQDGSGYDYIDVIPLYEELNSEPV